MNMTKNLLEFSYTKSVANFLMARMSVYAAEFSMSWGKAKTAPTLACITVLVCIQNFQLVLGF